jgi:hypothetical protein
MNDYTPKPTADYAPNEKKVWRPEAVEFVPTPVGKKEGVYFIAIEELQGAWIDNEWEEADSSETWTETATTTDSYTDEAGFVHTVVTETVKDFRKDIPRSRRYVLKRFSENGKAENAFSSGYAGPRQYQK